MNGTGYARKSLQVSSHMGKQGRSRGPEVGDTSGIRYRGQVDGGEEKSYEYQNVKDPARLIKVKSRPLR